MGGCTRDPNADGAMTMLYHPCVGGVNSAICGCRIVSTCPNSQVHKVIQHALHRQHWDPPRTRACVCETQISEEPQVQAVVRAVDWDAAGGKVE